MEGKITPKITLDGHALEKLFPPGTQAHLEIKQFAIDQIVNRMAPTAELEAYVHEAFIKKQFIDVLKNDIDNSTFNFNISQKAKDSIKNYITGLIDQQIRKIAQEVYEEMAQTAVDKFKTEINFRLENFFNDQTKAITSHCRKFITEKMQQIITAAIEETNTPGL